jgi:hypothetical protein
MPLFGGIVCDFCFDFWFQPTQEKNNDNTQEENQKKKQKNYFVFFSPVLLKGQKRNLSWY